MALQDYSTRLEFERPDYDRLRGLLRQRRVSKIDPLIAANYKLTFRSAPNPTPLNLVLALSLN
jgi:hypothetical protein